MTKLLEIEGRLLAPATEDSGNAMIAEVLGASDDVVFVRLHSWDESKQHEQLRDVVQQTQSKRVRITVELIDD